VDELHHTALPHSEEAEAGHAQRKTLGGRRFGAVRVSVLSSQAWVYRRRFQSGTEDSAVSSGRRQQPQNRRGKELCMNKNCALCGTKMVWEHPNIPGHFVASSCDIDGWHICHECMAEHCAGTNCLSCEYGKYPECDFLELKRHYMQND
jgi:hypothetical protein